MSKAGLGEVYAPSQDPLSAEKRYLKKQTPNVMAKSKASKLIEGVGIMQRTTSSAFPTAANEKCTLASSKVPRPNQKVQNNKRRARK